MYLSSALGQALCLLSAFRRPVFHQPSFCLCSVSDFEGSFTSVSRLSGSSQGADVIQEVHYMPPRRAVVSCILRCGAGWPSLAASSAAGSMPEGVSLQHSGGHQNAAQRWPPWHRQRDSTATSRQIGRINPQTDCGGSRNAPLQS